MKKLILIIAFAATPVLAEDYQYLQLPPRLVYQPPTYQSVDESIKQWTDWMNRGYTPPAPQQFGEGRRRCAATGAQNWQNRLICNY